MAMSAKKEESINSIAPMDEESPASPATQAEGDSVQVQDFEPGSLGPEEDTAQVSVYCGDEKTTTAIVPLGPDHDDDTDFPQDDEPASPASPISSDAMLIGAEKINIDDDNDVVKPAAQDDDDGDFEPLPDHKGVEEKSDEGLSSGQKAYLIALIAATTLSGVGHTWTLKWQNLMDVEVKSDGTTQAFTFPLFQSWFQFLGMSLWLLIYRVQLFRKTQRGEELVVGDDLPTDSLKVYHFIPLGLAQIGSTLLQCFGLSLTDPSTYAMIRGSVVIHSVWISIILLKKRYKPFEWSAVGIIALGLVLVFLAGTVGDGKKDPKPGMPSMEMQMVGNGLVLGATICSAAVAALQEKMMKQYSAPVTLLVGGGSLVAGVILTIVIAILQAVPVDDIRLFAYAFAHDWRCGVSSFLLGFCLFVFYYAAGQITRLASAVVIMMLGNLRIFVVWMISLALHTMTDEKFSFMQAAGFVVIVCGTMVYKSFIPLPFAWCYPVEEGVEDDEDADDMIFVPKDWLGSDDISAMIDANKNMPEADRLPEAALTFLLIVSQAKKKREEATVKAASILMTSVRFNRSQRSIGSNPLVGSTKSVDVAPEEEAPPPNKPAEAEEKKADEAAAPNPGVVETVQVSRRFIRAAMRGAKASKVAGLHHAARLRAAAAINAADQ